jgi:hypothetical protein
VWDAGERPREVDNLVAFVSRLPTPSLLPALLQESLGGKDGLF